jgi:hypothetical protein
MFPATLSFSFPNQHQRRAPVAVCRIARTAALAIAVLAFASVNAAVAVDPNADVKAASVPQQIKLQYRVYRSGLPVGVIDETFTRDAERYRVRSVTRTEGALALFYREELVAESAGEIAGAGLVPLSFASSRKSDPSRNFTARFDWSRGLLLREWQESGTTERKTFPLPAGTQDRLSSLYQFMLAPPRSNTVTAFMTQGKETERYVYVKRDEPVLVVGDARYQTVHYARDVRGSEPQAEIWLARDHHHVPVRAVFIDSRGARIEQRLVSLSVTP